jgi:hypothetical protein
MLPPNLRDYHLEIRCPRCDGRARWEEPFEIVDLKRHTVGPGETLLKWGGWDVREKFPSLVPWRPPRPGVGWAHYTQGVVRCGQCHLVAVHRLRWPADAFFRWGVRGSLLWAWHAEHAAVLHDYLAAKVRDPFRYPQPYPKSLQRLPRDVLAARSRERVARQIAATLAALGIPLDPPSRPPRARRDDARDAG